MSRLWIDLLSDATIESGIKTVYFGTLIDSTEPFTQVNDLVFSETAEDARAYGPYVLRCRVQLNQPRVIQPHLPDLDIRDSLRGSDEIDDYDGFIVLNTNGTKLFRPISADQVTIIGRLDK